MPSLKAQLYRKSVHAICSNHINDAPFSHTGLARVLINDRTEVCAY